MKLSKKIQRFFQKTEKKKLYFLSFALVLFGLGTLAIQDQFFHQSSASKLLPNQLPFHEAAGEPNRLREFFQNFGESGGYKGDLLGSNMQKLPPANYEDEVLTTFDDYTNPFSDTNTTTFEGKAASELYRRGVIGGFSDGTFGGTKPVNRAEAAKFLLLAKGLDVPDAENNGKFWDVKDGEWYVKFVIKAAKLGIIKGYSDGSFRPADGVRRGEFLKMITETFGLEKNLSHNYSDVSGTWVEEYAGIASKYELFPEKWSELRFGTFMTRDEVAVALYQYLGKKN